MSGPHDDQPHWTVDEDTDKEVGPVLLAPNGQAEVESLRTRLAATTTQRDAAYAVVRRTRDNWEPLFEEQIWRRYFFTQVAPKLVANHEDEPMTPDEAAVLDTTRDTHDE